ncbi:hypothetical protein RFI_14118 [Reticulomyxa filosa]|uniref:Uncharacterized protein n=1 Tax=Reticulomyxa filosa TaxID=46433 RepID=X6NCL8_RETFI|nr:hypothetical protein RFI_14118 [Reticulomyxa filosa]|eukprot:ETO23067.1 hypothetical protein RFI_14118 [Reticulomyxa filosa]
MLQKIFNYMKLVEFFFKKHINNIPSKMNLFRSKFQSKITVIPKQMAMNVVQLGKTSLEKQNGYLRKAEFASFWVAMEDGTDNVVDYLIFLLQALLQHLSNEKKHCMFFFVFAQTYFLNILSGHYFFFFFLPSPPPPSTMQF